VTVSGQSPVIDLSSTSTVANFTEEVLEGVPRSRDIWAVLDMAPGVIRAGAPDVGGSRIATDPAISTYGVTAQPKSRLRASTSRPVRRPARRCTLTTLGSRRFSSRPQAQTPKSECRASR
jgi:hypothetical protein